MSRKAFEGGEFDWFAVDAAGWIGHFSTAGFGPVPIPVLEQLDVDHQNSVWTLDERILELPITGTANGHLSGRIDDWLEMARRGLFSFDWKHWSGPYLKAATPAVPITIDAVPTDLRQMLWIVRFPAIRFADVESLRPEEHCDCG